VVDSLQRSGRASPARIRLLATVGPAFVAAVAYVDPGNFATNFAAGADSGYGLAWAIVLASAAAILVQYVTSKAGLATGASLPELCRSRFGRRANIVLWLQAEVVAMATDLAEFVGAAVGLHLVFGVPLLPAGLITAVVAFAVLALEQRHRSRFVKAVTAMLLGVAGCFGYLVLVAGDQRPGALAAGLVPHVGDSTALTLVVGIVGATVMPHVIYAHSALQAQRGLDAAERHRRLRLNRLDCAIGLSIAGCVNLSMLCVAAVLPSGAAPSGDLGSVHSALELVGKGCALAFGVALILSGFASSSVGTYAGQVVMSGFINRRIPLLARRLVTMLPSLVVLGSAADPSQALVYSQVVLSFGIPFALVPLVLVSRDRTTMGVMANRPMTTALLALVAAVITAMNLYLVYRVIR
jgi:manganese transport protein